MNERKLVRALKQGQRDALNRAIDRYSAYVGAVIANVLGARAAREDVEELVSDTFLALWRAASRLDDSGEGLRPYLATIARNAACSRLRRMRDTQPLPEDDRLTADEEEGPEPMALRRDAAERLRNAVDALTPPDREIFIRYYGYRQTIREIAGRLAMNPETVKTRLARGRKRLRGLLTEEEAERDAHHGAI